MLKEGVKKIPIYGTMLDKLGFIWLKRDWALDKEQIARKVKKLVDDGQPLWLVLFPEGITMNTKSKEKSQEFSVKESRPLLNHTLLPRSRGLEAVLENIKDTNPEIIDVTMGFESYSGEVPTWEMGYERNVDHLIPNAKKLFSGMSGDVVMSVEKFTYKDILESPLGVQGWLDERWKLKDEFLDKLAKGIRPTDAQSERSPRGSIKRLLILLSFDAMLLAVTISGVRALTLKMTTV